MMPILAAELIKVRDDDLRRDADLARLVAVRPPRHRTRRILHALGGNHSPRTHGPSPSLASPRRSPAR